MCINRPVLLYGLFSMLSRFVIPRNLPIRWGFLLDSRILIQTKACPIISIKTSLQTYSLIASMDYQLFYNIFQSFYIHISVTSLYNILIYYVLNLKHSKKSFTFRIDNSSIPLVLPCIPCRAFII